MIYFQRTSPGHMFQHEVDIPNTDFYEKKGIHIELLGAVMVTHHTDYIDIMW